MDERATLHLGQTLAFPAEIPWEAPPETWAVHERRGAVLVADGRIGAVAPAERLIAQHPDLPRVDHGAGLILPGFIDAHIHYPQTAIIASWGKRLIDWLEGYTFPEEARFADPAHAAAIAARFFDLTLMHGTTTTASYCTVHPESVEAFFAEALRRGLRQIGGKVMMDRNAPAGLTDTAEQGYRDSDALIARWHKRGRLGYAVTPRFAPTSTEAQLQAAAALWAAHPGTLLQTHLSEQTEELAWVASLFPGARDYLDVYDRAGLLGPGAVFGHAIHLSDREWARLSDCGAAIAHCPTSNGFIGSGLFDMARARSEGIEVGLATDVGGGSSFSMLRTMAAAYEVSQLRGSPLHPAELLWRATGGAAAALGLAGQIGRLAAGMEADLIILNLASTPPIETRLARAESVWDALFATIMLGDDRAVETVLIAGSPIAHRPF